MSGIFKLFITAVIAAAMVSVPMASAVVSGCNSVNSLITPCIYYSLGSAATISPACCDGIRNLNRIATTTADGRTICNCLKTLARSYARTPGWLSRANRVPGACGYPLGYTISPTLNCNNFY